MNAKHLKQVMRCDCGEEYVTMPMQAKWWADFGVYYWNCTCHTTICLKPDMLVQPESPTAENCQGTVVERKAA